MAELVPAAVLRTVTQPQMFAGVTDSFLVIDRRGHDPGLLVTRSSLAYLTSLVDLIVQLGREGGERRIVDVRLLG